MNAHLKYAAVWACIILVVMGAAVVIENKAKELRPAPRQVRMTVIPAPGQASVQLELGTDVKSLSQKLQSQLKELTVDGRIYSQGDLAQLNIGEKWSEVRFYLLDGSQVLLFKQGKEARHATP